jgi:hypothetical protein
MTAKFVRFLPKTSDLLAYSGWEGKAVQAPEIDEGMWRVQWQHKPEGLPDLVHERHLSFRIRKFSKRFE